MCSDFTEPYSTIQQPASDPWQQRFGGISRLYGEAAIARLKALHVCVIGLGGVGSWAVEGLARSGIGRLTLVDYDTVEASNINRQLPALLSTEGQKKATLLQARVRDINPDCSVEVIDDFLTQRNLAEIITNDRQYDHIIDAIDSIRVKAALIAHSRRLKIRIITTGGAGGQVDPTKIQVRDLSRTWNDPLAAKVRKLLRANYGFSKNLRRYFVVDCVFSTEQLRYPQADGHIDYCKPGISGLSLDCRLGYGAASYVTAVFGFVAVAKVLERTLESRQCMD
ncbi:MAG TPA: tRNA cyclic N6-threonylcarbamoyladenosine(37) synthase TcdA [Gammaproteobacteria bacterium]|nr:tRNA cyclic N6-threonylcarbamoyladenosine(37) synthase TcdA [Gammaproteobacteria bacterium]